MLLGPGAHGCSECSLHPRIKEHFHDTISKHSHLGWYSIYDQVLAAKLVAACHAQAMLKLERQSKP